MTYVVETGGGLGEQLAPGITVWGSRVLRYGLALVIAWIGLMKFTGYEANGIQTLVANSPLLGWAYHFLTVRQLSGALGVVEVGVALLIALRPWSAKASAIGSAMAALMFLTTLSFLFSTPGWEPSLGGFPALSAGVGQFLLKDVVLLGAALWSLGESLQSHTRDVGARRGAHIKRAAHSQVAVSNAGRRVRLHRLRIRARLRGAPRLRLGGEPHPPMRGAGGTPGGQRSRLRGWAAAQDGREGDRQRLSCTSYLKEERRFHMRTIRIMALAVLIVGGGSTLYVSRAQQTGIRRTDVLRHDLGVPGREVIQVRVDFAPGVAFGRHSHPGEEIAYVLEGTLEYEVEGKPPVTLKAGEALFIPAGAVHAAKNVGSGNGAELATYVVEKGKPLVVMAE